MLRPGQLTQDVLRAEFTLMLTQIQGPVTKLLHSVKKRRSIKLKYCGCVVTSPATGHGDGRRVFMSSYWPRSVASGFSTEKSRGGANPDRVSP